MNSDVLVAPLRRAPGSSSSATDVYRGSRGTRHAETCDFVEPGFGRTASMSLTQLVR